MSDTQRPIKPASPVRKTATKAALAGVNVVWLVPILALLVTIAVAWTSFANRGALIEIEFADATGITPGETKLRFREITVGQVEAVKFTSDLSSVSVQVRVDPDVAQYIDSEASFWIVRPKVTAQGVTRLDTVLTGAFIEGYWDSEVSRKQTDFIGLERPPLVRSDAKGSWIVLQMDSADGISEGAPILYRGVQVGQMDHIRLADDGSDTVIANAFIEAPHDARLSSATTFWDTSGFSLSFGTSGVAFNVNSLSSLLQGGVAFDTFASGGQAVGTGQIFTVYPDEDTARSNIFEKDQSDQLFLSMLVDNAVSGLEKGSDVQFYGLRVGSVRDISVFVQEPEDDELTPSTLQRVTIAISPSRLGLKTGATAEDALAFLQDAVRSGLRARVASTGFFGSSLMVELVNIPTATAAEIDMDAEPHPVIPAVEGDLSDFTQTAEGFMARIGELPMEEVLLSATDMMDSITALASSPDVRAIPESLRKTIDEAEMALNDVSAITKDLRDSGAAENMGKMVEDASAAFISVQEAADKVPALIEEIDAVAAQLAEVDFAAIGTQAEGVLLNIQAILSGEDVQALPQTLSNTLKVATGLLGNVNEIAKELRDSGAPANMITMVDEASKAFVSVQEAADKVPGMVDEIDEIATRMAEVDFAAIGTQAEGILADLRAMLGSEDAEALPRNLSDTLEAASGLLNDLRDGNAAGSLNNALESASIAADEIAESVQELPALLQRLQATAARADSVLAAYGNRSAFNAEAINVLRELRRATESLGSLARMIERNPRAFILGR